MRHRVLIRVVSGLALACCLLLEVAAAVESRPDARISAEQAALLGGPKYTPVGAERAANAEGTIPEWTGGILQPPSSYKSGGPHTDPFPEEKILFTITAQNYEKYRANLTDGQVALFEHYPDKFFMHVYPTRRSASFHERVYDLTKQTAQTVQYCDKEHWEHCLEIKVGGGFPFPFPRRGGEVVWNNTLDMPTPFQGRHRTRNYLVAPNGDWSYRELDELIANPYWMTPEEKKQWGYDNEFFSRMGGAVLCEIAPVYYPPKDAGQNVGACNYLHDPRLQAYIYLPGQRRVRKAPEIGFYDQPGTGSDGLHTSDMRTVFNLTGEEEWFNHKLLGKRELFVPYNSYKLANVDRDKLVQAGVMDHEPMRYELHRVWVVESTLRKEYRHLMPRAMSYFDEDSYRGLTGERWDRQGRLWRVIESYTINWYAAKGIAPYGTAYYDLQNGRWSTYQDWTNNVDFQTPLDPVLLTPQGLRGAGVR